MELKSPSPKRKGNHISKNAPLPVFFDGSLLDGYNDYGTFSGYFNGNSVIVDDPEEIKALYTMGCFGKASFSKGFPKFGNHKKDLPIVLKENQWERRKEWSDKVKNLIIQLNKIKEDKSSSEQEAEITSEVKTCQETTPMEINDEINEENYDTFSKEINLSISEANNFSESLCDENTDVLVINECYDVDSLLKLNPRIEVEQIKTVGEVLYLTLEESFFLSFALGCLQIMDITAKPLTLLQIWRMFVYSQSDFIESYVAYHYFRSKGWVVKSGIKYGGKFLLYKEGPDFFHASYIVLIENICLGENQCVSNKEGSITWNKMNNLNRMAESCKKEIVLCKIQWPQLTDADKENPLILKKFKVKEFLLRRWQPCQEKEISDLDIE